MLASFTTSSLNFITLIAASPMQQGIFYGLATSALLAASGYLALRWARNRSQMIFMWVLLGGFMGRLMVFGLVLIWVWKFSQLDARVFTWTLLVSYLLFQLIETLIFQRYFKHKKLTSKA
jgi:hypothetical protein